MRKIQSESENKILSVRIIIPARKWDYLADECILNIRKLYPYTKIILVLDELTENTTDDNLIIMKSQNKKMSAKRNLAAYSCDTEYLAFIDSDAYPNENWLEKAIEFLDKNDDYSAVTCRQYLPGDDSFEKQCLRLLRFSKIFTYPKWNKVIDKNSKEQDCTEFMTSNVIMRCDDYKAIGGMDENLYLAEDNEFSQRLIDYGFKIRFIPDVSVFHHECSFYPFMRKILCMAYLYSLEFVTTKRNKTAQEYFSIFFPLGVILLTIILYIFGLYFDEDVFLILNFPFFISIIFIYEACNLAQKLEKHKIQGFFHFLAYFISFCLVWLFGTFCGIFRVKVIDVEQSYRHY